MKIQLHKLAKTTPALRKYIWEEVNIKKRQLKELANELKLNVSTVSKWSKRDIINNPDEIYDRSHAKHNLNLLLNPNEEEVIIFCREFIGLSILDICSVLHTLFDKHNIKCNRIIKYSKNSIYKCILRHKVSTPIERYKKAIETEKEKEKIKEKEKLEKDNEDNNDDDNNNKNIFEIVNEPGFLHMDFKYLPRIKEVNPDYDIEGTIGTKNKKGNKKSNKKYISKRSYMFSAIDRYSRYVYTEILTDKSVENVSNFLKRVIKDFEDKTYNKETNKSNEIKVILTDNGGEFTDRFAVNSKLKKELNIESTKPTGKHLFDKICKEHNIEHRLTKPNHPQTNGMIERFNGRIAKALKEYKLFRGEFKIQQEMFNFILESTNKYNTTPLQCLHYKSPIYMLEEYKKEVNKINKVNGTNKINKTNNKINKTTKTNNKTKETNKINKKIKEEIKERAKEEEKEDKKKKEEKNKDKILNDKEILNNKIILNDNKIINNKENNKDNTKNNTVINDNQVGLNT